MGHVAISHPTRNLPAVPAVVAIQCGEAVFVAILPAILVVVFARFLSSLLVSNRRWLRRLPSRSDVSRALCHLFTILLPFLRTRAGGEQQWDDVADLPWSHIPTVSIGCAASSGGRIVLKSLDVDVGGQRATGSVFLCVLDREVFDRWPWRAVWSPLCASPPSPLSARASKWCRRRAAVQQLPSPSLPPRSS
ncbi:hypothetical protein C8R43DRAFT_1131642 [Mycena crocata]|nr:hypothetical protein C8R43DRAFT_1131642 [Mycena crocata]